VHRLLLFALARPSGRAFIINDRQARKRCGSIAEDPLASDQEKINEWPMAAQTKKPTAGVGFLLCAFFYLGRRQRQA
jgi:hypothetical protein